MKKLGYWKSRKEWKQLTQGMSPDQVARLKQSLSQGDDATVAAITEIQAEQRETLRAQGIDTATQHPKLEKKFSGVMF